MWRSPCSVKIRGPSELPLRPLRCWLSHRHRCELVSQLLNLFDFTQLESISDGLLPRKLLSHLLLFCEVLNASLSLCLFLQSELSLVFLQQLLELFHLLIHRVCIGSPCKLIIRDQLPLVKQILHQQPRLRRLILPLTFLAIL